MSHPDDDTIRSYGFIWVPGTDDALPQINLKAPPLRVESESRCGSTSTSTWSPWADRACGSPTRGTVRATHANGDPLVVNDHTLRFTSADRYFGPASITFEVTDGTLGKRSERAYRDPDAADHGAIRARTSRPCSSAASSTSSRGSPRSSTWCGSPTTPTTTSTSWPTRSWSPASRVHRPAQRSAAGAHCRARRRSRGRPRRSASASRMRSTPGRPGGSSCRSCRRRVRSPSRSRTGRSPSAGRRPSSTCSRNDEANNPFPDTPLRVVDIRGLDGANAAGGVTVTPSADKSRACGSASRRRRSPPTPTCSTRWPTRPTTRPAYVWGTVTISVQDVPDPVSNFRVTEFGDRTLKLALDAGAFNNSPITEYRVTMSDATTPRRSARPVHGDRRMRDHHPGNGPTHAVRLSVVAVNAIGASTATSLVGTIWSDIIPPPPTNLSASPIDHGLRFTWTSRPTATRPADRSVRPHGRRQLTHHDVDDSDPVGRPVLEGRARRLPPERRGDSLFGERAQRRHEQPRDLELRVGAATRPARRWSPRAPGHPLRSPTAPATPWPRPGRSRPTAGRSRTTTSRSRTPAPFPRAR